MLSYNELKPGVSFIKDGEPYTVLEYNFIKKQRGKPVVQLKLKNLISRKVTDYTARQNETFEKTEIEKKPAQFIYHKHLEYWFKNPENPSDRFKIDEEIIGNAKHYLTPNLEVKALLFKTNIINIELPIKVDLMVAEAPPGIKGSTADGGTKTITTETGYSIKTPLFIGRGDIIRVNTETGEYTERVEKK